MQEVPTVKVHHVDAQGYPLATVLSDHARSVIESELAKGACDLIERVGKSFGGWQWFCTFTFKDTIHAEQASRRYGRFMRDLNFAACGRRFRERGVSLFHVRAMEFQRRGVVHFHSLVGGGVDSLNRIWWKEKWLYQDVGNGFARIYQFDPCLGATHYLGKYIAKGAELDFFTPWRDVPRPKRDQGILFRRRV